MNTWLIVFVGKNIEQIKHTMVQLEAQVSLEQAHHLLLTELDGERHALLLVHWTALERDVLLEQVSSEWSYFFVNQVQDLEHGEKAR